MRSHKSSACRWWSRTRSGRRARPRAPPTRAALTRPAEDEEEEDEEEEEEDEEEDEDEDEEDEAPRQRRFSFLSSAGGSGKDPCFLTVSEKSSVGTG